MINLDSDDPTVQVTDGTVSAVFKLSDADGPRETDLAILNEVWLEDVYHLAEVDLKEKVVVDIGAHMGAYAIRAALHGAVVYAYEVDPVNKSRVVDHVVINALEQESPIHVVGAAVVAPSASARSYVRDAKTGMAEVTAPGSQRFDRHPTPSVTLTDIIEDATSKDADKRVAHMKVDIEGCEYEALIGAPLIQVDLLAIEFHKSDPGDLGMLLEHLLRTHSVQSFGDPRKGGMIHARRYGS